MIRAVLFIPTLTAGGAERVASVLANEWCNYPDARVSVITLFNDPAFYPIDPSIEHVCLGIFANKGGFSRLVDLFRALLALRRTVTERNPTFVLSFMNKYNFFCIAALLGTKLKVIVAERGSPTEALSKLRVILRKLTYPHAAAVLVQSRAAKEFIASTTRNNHVVVIYNPITQIIHAHDRQPQKIILNISRLHPQKGHADLLDAFAATRMEGWSLVLCGDGPLRSTLEQRAHELGISAQTHFLGTVTDLRPHLQSASIFIFPSYSEGFPNALAEAMLAGLPCISYDCPTGPSELIEDGVNGILIPLGDISRLKNALMRLMTDQDLAARLGHQATLIAEQVDKHSVSRLYWNSCLHATKDGIE